MSVIANGATVSAGAGISVSNVAFVSSARLTASFVIDGSTTAGPRDVIVANPGDGAGTQRKERSRGHLDAPSRDG